jgi:hypothetical protein
MKITIKILLVGIINVTNSATQKKIDQMPDILENLFCSRRS